ncbi:glycosyl hydrolase, partial [Mordavella massiliensis]|nr:glycosyl hydrolase [Mordavella massiliensis]
MANSWRFKNGERIVQDSPVPKARSARAITPWTNINGVFYNSIGQAIEGVVAKGIDVSQWNGDVDWGTVKNTDVDYAIIRCGYGMDQTNQDDPKWKSNADACTAYDIPFGVYIYSYADTVERAVSEAKHVLRLVKGYNLTYPI